MKLEAVTVGRTGDGAGSAWRQLGLAAGQSAAACERDPAAGREITSDPVDFPVVNQDDVVVSLHVGAGGAQTTAHPLGLRATARPAVTRRSRFRLRGETMLRLVPPARRYRGSGRAELPPRSWRSVDSITDGYSTTPDADTPWPSILARRLAASARSCATRRDQRRHLRQPHPARRRRLERAGAFRSRRALAPVRWVLLLEGINDISFGEIPGLPASEKATLDDLLAGYRQLIARSRIHGLRVIGGTLTPSRRRADSTCGR